MANMFRCTLASGGGALVLTVTCDADFAGLTITATDGTTTLTQTCPSTSPYEVEFNIPNSGQWTISGVISGDIKSIIVDIPSTAVLHNIPNGSTVTPTDDVQTWLHCAEIWDKNYTTVSQVLSDASTLQALIASTNAVDYMARSTTWVSDVTADQSAMSYIGLNDYCADALLADSNWLNAICNNTYFESVLNVKVPTMTSATSPSGEVSAGNIYGSQYGWLAFDGKTNTGWLTSNAATDQTRWIQYEFPQSVKISKVTLINGSYQTARFLKNFKILGSNDNSNFTQLYSGTTSSDSQHSESHSFPFNSSYRYIRLLALSSWSDIVSIDEMNFYGRLGT